MAMNRHNVSFITVVSEDVHPALFTQWKSADNQIIFNRNFDQHLVVMQNKTQTSIFSVVYLMGLYLSV